MSRVAVYYALTHDPTLNALGIDSTTVFANYSLDAKPSVSGPFVILRWLEDDAIPFGDVKPPRNLTIWVHYPTELGPSFKNVDDRLDAIDNVLKAMVHVSGSDGYTVTSIRPTGRSGDLKDEAWQTITRNAAYQVLARKD